MKKLSFLILLLLPLLVLYGCGNSGSTSTSATSAKTGSLSVAAKFPSAGKQGEVGAALIDTNTTCIKVDVYTWSGTPQRVFLTPTSPSNIITDIGVGDADIFVYTSDGPLTDDVWGPYCAGNQLDHLYVAGSIAEGSNALTATLIRGTWTLDTPITLNKTLANSTETITGFTVLPWFGLGQMAIDDQKPSGVEGHALLWKGSGLGKVYNGSEFRYCPSTDEICQGSALKYYNQFIGPSTGRNALDEGELSLTPAAEYPGTIYDYGYGQVESNRFASFFGIPIDFDSANVWYGEGAGYGHEGGGATSMTNSVGDDVMPLVNSYATTKVTGANTMSGNIIEMLEKAGSGTQTCVMLYDGWGTGPTNQVVTCPQGVGPAKLSAKSFDKAVLKATSGAVGKSMAEVNGCFDEDVTVSGTETWTQDYVDVWNSDPSAYYTPNCGEVDGTAFFDGTDWICDNTCCGDGYYDPIEITDEWTGTVKLCRHAFTATGSQIPTQELSLILQ